MKSQNICKFPTAPLIAGTLSIHCFVREADMDTMRRHASLKSNRMILVVQGNGAFCASGASVSFHRGSLVFGFAGEDFWLADGENIVYIYIDFDGIRSAELFRRFNVNSLLRTMDGFDGLIPVWQESLAGASEHTLDLTAEGILLHTFSRLYRTDSDKAGLIGRIAEITEEHFNDPRLSLATLADRLSYHPKYVSHVFKERMGVSYSEYLRSVRMRYATSLFDHGIDSVKNVAMLSGFSDPLYFSSVFKKHVGKSPREYIDSRGKKV